MKEKWLKFVLNLTNKIFTKKKEIINKEGVGVIASVISLFFYELFLAIVSFPLYLGVKPKKVVAFFKEKGAYDQVSYDYSLRRILTLTSASIIFLIWMIKLAVILFTPSVTGPLNLYAISDLEPADILETDLIITETQIQTARVVDIMNKPKLETVEKTRRGGYIFSGTGQPLTTIVLFLSDKHTAIYTDEIDKDGNWQVEYTREDFSLSEGNHAIVAFCYDAESSSRSPLSEQQYFKATNTLADKLFQSIDVFLNFTLIIIIALGILLIVLTI